MAVRTWGKKTMYLQCSRSLKIYIMLSYFLFFVTVSGFCFVFYYISMFLLNKNKSFVLFCKTLHIIFIVRIYSCFYTFNYKGIYMFNTFFYY